jgi:hypothetical protein
MVQSNQVHLSNQMDLDWTLTRHWGMLAAGGLKPMKPDALSHRSVEIELKLALPTSHPASLAKRLAQTPALACRKATHQHLHNIYYDTPEQILRQQRVALRIRRIT